MNRTALLSAVVALGIGGACASETTTPAARSAGTLYMDVHELGAGNVTAEAVAEAHAADLRVQDAHGVSFLRYWVDEANGVVYCLAEAPNADAIVDAHREAHGLLPDVVGPVVQGE